MKITTKGTVKRTIELPAGINRDVKILAISETYKTGKKVSANELIVGFIKDGLKAKK